MLDSQLLNAFMNTFFGYGNLDAELWFVGMEEGGGNSEKEIQIRLNKWASRGRRVVEDAAEFHRAIEMGTLFDGKGKMQPTWEQLIRTIFKIQGRRETQSEMRSFQNECFGRSGGCAAFLELLPLPSPSIGRWYYGSGQGKPRRCWTNISFLQTRPKYERQLRPDRCARLRHLISFHRPKAVVFYGGVRDRLASEFGANFDQRNDPASFRGTHYMHLVHPTYRYRGHTRAKRAAIYAEAGRTLGGIGVTCDN